MMYLLELRTTEPPSMNRVPELVALCKATVRASSYVVPPIIKITTSWGLHKHESEIPFKISEEKKEQKKYGWSSRFLISKILLVE